MRSPLASMLRAHRPRRRRSHVPDVPHHHGSRAVVTLGNGAFEIEVGDGMIFDLHGEALVGGIERRTFRNSPRLQHAVHFQAEIVMQAGCAVLLDDEATLSGLAQFRRRLRCLLEISFSFVFFERHAHLDEHRGAPCCKRFCRTRARTTSKSDRRRHGSDVPDLNPDSSSLLPLAGAAAIAIRARFLSRFPRRESAFPAYDSSWMYWPD